MQCNAELAHLGNEVSTKDHKRKQLYLTGRALRSRRTYSFLRQEKQDGAESPELHGRARAWHADRVPGMTIPKDRGRSPTGRASFSENLGDGLQIEGRQLPNPVERKANARLIPTAFPTTFKSQAKVHPGNNLSATPPSLLTVLRHL